MKANLCRYKNGVLDTVPWPSGFNQAFWSSIPWLVENNGLLYFELQEAESNSEYINVAFDGVRCERIPWTTSSQNIIIPDVTYKNQLLAHATVFDNSSTFKTSFSYLSDTIEILSCKGQTLKLGTDQKGQSFSWQLFDRSFKDIQEDAIFLNTKASYLTINNSPSAIARKFFRCVIDGKPSVVFKIKFENTFIASPFFTRNWENPLYWTCGEVADENTSVYITGGLVNLNQSTSIKSLTIDPGVLLKLEAGVQLTIK